MKQLKAGDELCWWDKDLPGLRFGTLQILGAAYLYVKTPGSGWTDIGLPRDRFFDAHDYESDPSFGRVIESAEKDLGFYQSKADRIRSWLAEWKEGRVP